MNSSCLATPESRVERRQFYLRTLLDDVLPFWFPRALDQEHGGFLHCFDADGSLVDSDKSIWAQGRMSWMLLTLYNTVEPRPEWLAWAEHGLRFLDQHAFDSDGRMFFHVTRDGQPIRKRRYAYSEAFAAIAWAAHAKATGQSQSAERASKLLNLFLEWNFTPGRMPAKFTDVRPTIGLAPRMIALVTIQELRVNLGISEYDTTATQLVEEIERLFYKPDLGALMETVAPDGTIVDHFDGRLLNPGHALECAWFIMREGHERGRPDWLVLGRTIVDCMWQRGWDREHGGILYFTDLYHKPVQEYWHDMKFWWPHNEALLAALSAWRFGGGEGATARYAAVHDWAFKHFPDGEHGEWFGYLHRDGRRSTTLKGNLWKSCFHLPRMLWYAARLLDDEPWRT
jgi:N-acylglucosamine 2-epimerase